MGYQGLFGLKTDCYIPAEADRKNTSIRCMKHFFLFIPHLPFCDESGTDRKDQ